MLINAVLAVFWYFIPEALNIVGFFDNLPKKCRLLSFCLYHRIRTKPDISFVLKRQKMMHHLFWNDKTDASYLLNGWKPKSCTFQINKNRRLLRFTIPGNQRFLRFQTTKSETSRSTQQTLQPNTLTPYNEKNLLCMGQGHLCNDTQILSFCP